MDINEIYTRIDEEPLDLPFKKALLALVLKVDALEENLVTSPAEIRVPNDDFIETRQDDGTYDTYYSLSGIRRLNANAKITEVSE